MSQNSTDFQDFDKVKAKIKELKEAYDWARAANAACPEAVPADEVRKAREELVEYEIDIIANALQELTVQKVIAIVQEQLALKNSASTTAATRGRDHTSPSKEGEVPVSVAAHKTKRGNK